MPCAATIPQWGISFESVRLPQMSLSVMPRVPMGDSCRLTVASTNPLGPMSSPTSSPYDGIAIAGNGGVWTRLHRHTSVVGNDLDADSRPQRRISCSFFVFVSYMSNTSLPVTTMRSARETRLRNTASCWASYFLSQDLSIAVDNESAAVSWSPGPTGASQLGGPCPLLNINEGRQLKSRLSILYIKS